MERWLFLRQEPIKKISSFSHDLNGEFGGDYWNFSRFVPGKAARQPTPKKYSLDDCFREIGRLEDVKLIIGQKILFDGPTIRFAFRYADIWADFILEYTDERYQKTGELFTRTFSHTIESYPNQQTLNQ